MTLAALNISCQKSAKLGGLLLLLFPLPQVLLVPLVANIPQALPIEVLQVSQTQAASELGGTERVGRDRKGEMELF